REIDADDRAVIRPTRIPLQPLQREDPHSEGSATDDRSVSALQADDHFTGAGTGAGQRPGGRARGRAGNRRAPGPFRSPPGTTTIPARLRGTSRRAAAGTGKENAAGGAASGDSSGPGTRLELPSRGGTRC